MKRRCIGWVALAVLLPAVGLAVFRWFDNRREHRFDPQIEAAGRRYGVDPLLIKAVVWRESRFNAGTRGKAGEIGLMQIQELAAQEWADAERIRSFTHEHCLDPGTNTLAATYYLGKLMKRYRQTDDPVPYALADYNAGRTHVLRWNNGAAATNSSVFLAQITFPGTRKYVESVMRQYARYKAVAPQPKQTKL